MTLTNCKYFENAQATALDTLYDKVAGAMYDKAVAMIAYVAYKMYGIT